MPTSAPPATSERAITSRTANVRAASADQEARTVRAVIASSKPARVYDWARMQLIDETLVIAGMEIRGGRGQVPLLRDHHQWSIDEIRGSVREIAPEGENVLGMLHFHDDEAAESAWRKVIGGHLTDVSIGYQPLEWTDIPPGESQEINGTTYTAEARTLRITTSWEIHEVSLVPIGADDQASMRSRNMPRLRIDPSALRSLVNERADDGESYEAITRSLATAAGLSLTKTRTILTASDASITSKQARAWATELGVDVDDLLAERAMDDEEEREDAEDDEEREGHEDGEEREGDEDTEDRQDDEADDDLEELADDDESGDAAERGTMPESAEMKRRKAIRSAGATMQIDQASIDAAIDEGITIDEARARFIDEMGARRSAPLGNSATGSIGGSRSGADAQALDRAARAMLHEPTYLHQDLAGRTIQASADATRTSMRLAGKLLELAGHDPLAGLNLDDDARREAERAMNSADGEHIRGLVGLAEAALRAEGRAIPADVRDTVRSAFSTLSLNGALAATVNKVLVQEYEDAPDSTEGWTRRDPTIRDFKQGSLVRMGKASRLTVQPPGTSAEHMSLDDSSEPIKVKRYSGQIKLDEQTIIDDDLGALVTIIQNMAGAAASVVPDLVYSLILTNANLTDGTPLFDASRGNYGDAGSTLGKATLEAGVAAMANQRQAERVLNLRASHLIVPQDLIHEARQLTQSAMLITGTGDETGASNPLMADGITPVGEARLGAAGVVDPDTGQTITGDPANWLLAAGGPAAEVTVGFLRGSGGRPRLRSAPLTHGGEYGVSYDVSHDVAAGVADALGLYFATGAA